ncbi:MAG: HD-GYP domain-containing protein [Thermotoga caldifontis]|uniref:HD-GYP domain-containing protein n=1 Tax=Thermotoga caldifontis TaxID=1508419 RepID=UPI003C7C035E
MQAIQFPIAEGDVPETLRRIRKKHGVDVIALFALRQGLAVHVITSADRPVSFIAGPVFNLGLAPRIEGPLFKMQSFENHPQETHFALVEGAAWELYIPVVFREFLTGFVYVASKETGNSKEIITDLQAFLEAHGLEYYYLEYSVVLDHILTAAAILMDRFFSRVSRYTLNHMYNVAFWAEGIGKKAGLDEKHLAKLYLAGLLHDVGKIYVSERILNKEGRLTAEEYEEMKKHVDYSYNIVKDLMLWDVESHIADWVLQHHEKFDGSGYPFGLRGEEITLEGRILKIADALDAMLSPRSYRDPFPLSDVIWEIRRFKGKDFDPVLADLAIDLLNEKKESPGLFEGRMLPATLVAGEKVHEGILRRTERFHVFISDTFDFSEHRGTLFVSRYNSLHKFNVKISPLDHDKAKLEIEETSASTRSWWDPVIGVLESDGMKRNVIISNISNGEIVFILSGVRDMEVDNERIFKLESPEGSYVGFISNKVRVAGVPHFIFKKVKERR